MLIDLQPVTATVTLNRDQWRELMALLWDQPSFDNAAHDLADLIEPQLTTQGIALA